MGDSDGRAARIATGIEVILTVLVIGGAFALLDATGALARLLGALLGRGLRPPLVLVSVSLVCAIGGAAEQMHEEFIALMPVLVVLSLRLGYGAITAVMMSMGAAAVGAAFGPTNPFGTGSPCGWQSSRRAARWDCGSRCSAPRSRCIAWTLFRARQDDIRPALDVVEVTPPSWRDAASLAALVLPIVIYVWGVLRFDWGFNQLTGMFLVAGFVVGLLQRMSLDVTTAGFIRGMETMLGAGLLVGIARAISIVLTDGRVIDTTIAWSVAPARGRPADACRPVDDSGARHRSHSGALHERASRPDDADYGADGRPAGLQPRHRGTGVPSRRRDVGSRSIRPTARCSRCCSKRASPTAGGSGTPCRGCS